MGNKKSKLEKKLPKVPKVVYIVSNESNNIIGIFDNIDDSVKCLLTHGIENGNLLQEWIINSKFKKIISIEFNNPPLLLEQHKSRFKKTRSEIFKQKIKDINDLYQRIELSNEYSQAVNNWYRTRNLFTKSDQIFYEDRNPFPSN